MKALTRSLGGAREGAMLRLACGATIAAATLLSLEIPSAQAQTRGTLAWKVALVQFLDRPRSIVPRGAGGRRWASPAAAAQAPLGLLVAQRPSRVRLALVSQQCRQSQGMSGSPGEN
jgi:hypothetical protein